jgi:ATP-dependent RNA helicase RhlE
VEKLIGKKIPVIDNHPFPLTAVAPEAAPKKKPQQQNRQSTYNHNTRIKPKF